jgi:starch synthase
MVTRVVSQKGFDLLAHVLDEMLMMDLQMVVLGTGEKKYEDLLLDFAWKYPNKLGVKLIFDDPLAHKIYAASDILLMPSQFEPCGLSQMIAMRYGTIPIVRETGGLKDTVIPYNESTGDGNGFRFANYNAHELLFTVQNAVRLYYEDKAVWKGIAENARKSDFSWKSSAKKYWKLYQGLG